MPDDQGGGCVAACPCATQVRDPAQVENGVLAAHKRALYKFEGVKNR